jgi:TonB family protein
MITRRFHRIATCALLAGAPLVAGAAHAQSTSVNTAKGLYASASYDDALTALGGDDSNQAQEYRALCLLALGRTDEARRATESLVSAHPEFVVSDEETPPRFVALLTEVRRKLLPAAIRKRFADGRDKFQAKAYDEARTAFRSVLDLSADPLMKGAEEVTDLGVLATGFLDLTNAATAAPKPAAPPAPPPVVARPPEIVPPVAIRQTIPPWPRAASTSGPTATVRLRVLVGADGRVKTAAVLTPTRPQFDLELVGAAQNWLYKPGTLNGEPVPMDKVVSLVIDTR